MTDLIARLEAAEAGSREFDREIMALHYTWERRHIGATCWDDDGGTCCPGAQHLDGVWVDPADDRWKTTAKDGFEFTTSIDAALALASRVLPGWEGEIDFGRRGFACLHPEQPYPAHLEYNAEASTPALALCAAILRAKGSEK
jgi:hypothetical protein